MVNLLVNCVMKFLKFLKRVNVTIKKTYLKRTEKAISSIYFNSNDIAKLIQLRNMVGQFKQTYLHRPIKILHILTTAKIQKCLT